MIRVPAPLKKGDTIGIVCPAGYMPAKNAAICISTLQQWGFQVKIGKTLGHQHHYFSGTDAERLADLQQMLDDASVKAILCGRGGYGVSRIIDQIDWTRFKKQPKWIIGYSDITVLHAELYTKLKTASLHSPMAGAFNDGGVETPFVQALKPALLGKAYRYVADAHALNQLGQANGELVGGNLSLVTHLLGTKSAFKTKGKILFLEDVGEYLYNVDRMFIQLKRTGMLDGLAALIIGGFTEMKDTTTPFGQDILTIIKEQVKAYNYPICFDFPVSHTERNYPLCVGMQHDLNIKSNSVTLKLINE